MDINDIFKGPNNRPGDDPNFWKLSSIILHLDGKMEGVETHEERDAIWKEALEEVGIGDTTLSYMAVQRALRALGVVDAAGLQRNSALIPRLAAMWCEGFVVGANYHEGTL